VLPSHVQRYANTYEQFLSVTAIGLGYNSTVFCSIYGHIIRAVVTFVRASLFLVTFCLSWLCMVTSLPKWKSWKMKIFRFSSISNTVRLDVWPLLLQLVDISNALFINTECSWHSSLKRLNGWCKAVQSFVRYSNCSMRNSTFTQKVNFKVQTVVSVEPHRYVILSNFAGYMSNTHIFSLQVWRTIVDKHRSSSRGCFSLARPL